MLSSNLDSKSSIHIDLRQNIQIKFTASSKSITLKADKLRPIYRNVKTVEKDFGIKSLKFFYLSSLHGLIFIVNQFLISQFRINTQYV